METAAKPDNQITAYAGASYNDRTLGRSSYGYLVMVNGITITSKASYIKRQTLSVAESEFISGSYASNEVIGISRILEFIIGKKPPTPILYMDSNAAIFNSIKPGGSESNRMRHIDPMYYRIRSDIQEKNLTVEKVKGIYNIADMMTKPLSADKLGKLIIPIFKVPGCRKMLSPVDLDLGDNKRCELTQWSHN